MLYVSESLIVLQNDKLVALIYPDFDEAFANGLQQPDIEKAMENNRIELNLQLPSYSQITKVKIHFEEFEKTAKKSIKRFMYQEAKGNSSFRLFFSFILSSHNKVNGSKEHPCQLLSDL